MRTHSKLQAAAIIATTAVLTLHVGAASAESNGGVRVMPLGDSITEGTQVPGGSRIGLWQRFTTNRYTVDFVGSQFHGGANSLLRTGRTAAWNGPAQDLTSKLTNGRSYTTSVWMRTQTGAPTGKVTLALTAHGTTNYHSLAQGAVNSSGWTQLTGTTAVSWTGTLSSARFYVETTSGTDNVYIDDASLQ